MSIDYLLALATDMSLERVGELAAVTVAERPARTGYGRLLAGGQPERDGYSVTIYGGRQGYYEARADRGTRWLWEPEDYVELAFHMRKDTLSDLGRPNMLRTVAKVLGGTVEDAALLVNNDVLLLTRVGGVLHRHNQEEWEETDYRNFRY
ncbi:SitI3 family protein [Polymorphospora sp. NPDC050346]|uniref:SitI3 family protein n=1 Tax=Polymorphospora sp. NPDC050346 TaxID=3155780 RepID=UPI00340CFC13